MSKSEDQAAAMVNQALPPMVVAAMAQYQYYRTFVGAGFSRAQAFQLLRDFLAASRGEDAASDYE
jgi:hypothetical protein